MFPAFRHGPTKIRSCRHFIVRETVMVKNRVLSLFFELDKRCNLLL